VYQALLKDDHRFEDILSYGDSSGGGLAASVILKMRDQRLGMPAAAVLVSPWVDVTRTGDTEFTLQRAEPNYLYDQHSKNAAGAYADPKDQKHPYVSPVYGDFSKGFPPTLIQGGTKEILLSASSVSTKHSTQRTDSEVGYLRGYAAQFRLENSRCTGVESGAQKIQDFVRLHFGEGQRLAARAAV